MSINVKIDNDNDHDIIKKRPEPLWLYGVNVNDFSPPFQLLGLATAVFFIYMAYGFFQELIFAYEGYNFGLFMTFCMFFVYVVLAAFAVWYENTPKSSVQLHQYVIIGALTVGTMALSNASLVYLSYPLQVIFKSCKVIPVMGAGFLFFRKRYSALEVGSMVLLAVGLIFFTLGDISVEPDFDWIGIIMISMALGVDAVIGNYQEQVMKNNRCSVSEMVLYTHLTALFFVFLAALANQEFFAAIEFCNNQPIIYLYTFVMSVCCYFGINFVLATLQCFGPVITVTITTTRKFFTILSSFLLFPKPVTAMHIISGTLVFVALFGDMYAKNGPKVLVALDTIRKEISRLVHK